MISCTQPKHIQLLFATSYKQIPITVAPSSSPLIKSGSSVDARTVLLQWKPLPLQYHNGLLRQYWINITEEDTGESKIETVTDTVGVLVDLTPSFTYHFRVSAYTVAVGPYSDPIAVTMPQNGESLL